MQLYDKDAYASSFRGHVLSCTQCKKGYDVILDKTLFFPEEGGQTCDKGTLNGIEVIDVQIENDVVHHYVREEISGEVEGIIDFSYRYSNMQNHTGEHILSGMVHQIFGYNNVGFHLGDNDVTADYDGLLSSHDIKMIEEKVNQAIYQNIKVETFYLGDEDIDYRSKKEIEGDLRIVRIEGVDTCACCAPHVSYSGEVGLVKILKAIKHRGGTRVFFLCGKRAFDYLCHIHDEASTISAKLSAPIESISDYVTTLQNETLLLKAKIASIQKEMIQNQIETLEMKDNHVVFVEEMDRGLQQYYVNALASKAHDFAAVFAGSQNNYRFLIVSHQDARIYLNEMKEKFTVKGGGKANMVQGSVEANQEELFGLDFLRK